jgi:RHS repeat-associated protein
MRERSESADYRYGFNGMEKNDDDIWGIKDSYDFGERMYDSRIGRWFKIDPQASQMPQISPYSFALNNPVFLIDEDGEIPIIPFLIKATASAAADALLQASMIYLTDDSVKDFGSAFKKIDKSDVAWSFVEGLNPFKVPGGKLGKAAAVATADLLIYVGEQTLDGKEITAADAGREFMIGFLSELAGDKVGELLSNKKVRAKVGALIGEKELNTMIRKVDNILPPWNGPTDYSHLVDSKTVGAGKNFTANQKAKILQANRDANGGYLRSDLDGSLIDTPVQSQKGVKANMNQAEVDHVVPKKAKTGAQGSNSYNNVQVLSKKQNLKKSNN